MEPETKGIRYQSATYPKVQNLMHHVNEQTLMLEHRKQARKTSIFWGSPFTTPRPEVENIGLEYAQARRS